MASKRLWFIPIAVLFIGLAAGIRPPRASSAVPLASQLECPIISPPIDIWLDGLDNDAPSVAFNPLHDEFLVTWYTIQQGFLTYDIWAARVALDGQIRSSFNVVSKGGEIRQYPRVAYSPVQDKYLIAYRLIPTPSSPYNLYLTMVNWNGSNIEAERRVRQDSSAQNSFSVAYNEANDEFLVVYENYPQTGNVNIAAQRLRASDGGRESWRQIYASTAGISGPPDVAYSPWLNGYLIVHDQDLGTSAREGYYAWANHDLTQLSSGNLARSSHPMWTYGQVAAGPGEFLYVWQKRTSGSGSDIYARRFDADGKPLGPAAGFPIAGEGDTDWHFSPQVAYAGSMGYLVVWTYQDSTGNYNVLGTYVPTGQGQVAGVPFPIFDAQNEEFEPSLACAPWGICLVAIDEKADSVSDIDIRGKFVRPCARIYLPIVVR